jgi:hypothetical protein
MCLRRAKEDPNAPAKRAREDTEGMVATDRPSRSFQFRRADGSSTYFHTLTWSPGSLTLFGDVGEATLRHWQALQHLESGLSWASNSSVDYLLEKSTETQEFDENASVDHIVRYANEAPFEALWGRVDRWYRRDPAGNAEEIVRRVTGAMHEMREWRKTPEDERECLPEVLQPFQDRSAYHDVRRYHDYDGWSFDEAWHWWFRIWQYLRKEGLVYADDPNKIRSAAFRRELKSGIEEIAGRGHDAFATFCVGIGFDDFYGTTDYSWRSRYKIEVIRLAARRMLDAIITEGQGLGDPVM